MGDSNFVSSRSVVVGLQAGVLQTRPAGTIQRQCTYPSWTTGRPTMADPVHGPEVDVPDRLLDEFAAPGYKQWRDEVDRLLKGAPYDKKMRTPTAEGITLEPLYRREDLQDLTFVESLPGLAPFVRGDRTFHGDADGWDIAQEIACPDPETVNKALRHDLERGLTVVHLPLDAATRRGLGPGKADAALVGKGGVSIASAADLEKALDSVDLARTPVILQAGASGAATTAFLAAVAKTRGIPTEKLSGAVAMDPIAELVTNGSLSLPLEAALDETTELLWWAEANAPAWKTVWVHGEPWHNAGGSAVQELAFALAGAVEYLRELTERSLAADTITKHLAMSLSAGSNFFMEVAKFRAARILWNRVLETVGVPESDRALWLHARTSRFSKTAVDPYVNMLRVTTEAFSGAVGGADSMHVAPFDEAVREPDEFSRRIARNVQLILRDEAHLAHVLDPAGGSYYVETLTDQVAQSAWDLFRKIEDAGGLIRAIRAEVPQKAVHETAKLRAGWYATRKAVIVGVNQYPNPAEEPIEEREPDRAALKNGRAKDVAAGARAETLPSTLADLQVLSLEGAGRATLIGKMIEAAEQGADIDELHANLAWRRGDGITATPLGLHRASEPIERLRRAVESHRRQKRNIVVYLATVGSPARYMPRLDFAASFFEVGGFDVRRT
ncbi:methylmalonyl-CoA mutase, partial [bacterium]|nr:methylmalonyl-CoA mutase [bacterium]